MLSGFVGDFFFISQTLPIFKLVSSSKLMYHFTTLLSSGPTVLAYKTPLIWLSGSASYKILDVS